MCDKEGYASVPCRGMSDKASKGLPSELQGARGQGLELDIFPVKLWSNVPDTKVCLLEGLRLPKFCCLLFFTDLSSAFPFEGYIRSYHTVKIHTLGFPFNYTEAKKKTTNLNMHSIFHPLFSTFYTAG